MYIKRYLRPDLKIHLFGFFQQFFAIKLRIYFAGLGRFFVNYRLAIIVAFAFSALIVSLYGLKIFEKSALVALVPGISDGDKGYSSLLTSDPLDEFNRGNTDEASNTNTQNAGNTSGTGTPGSFTINPQTNSTTGGASNGGNAGGGQTEQPSLVFQIALTDFRHLGTELVCTNPSNPKKGTCSKKYIFTSSVQTNNGPSTVAYSWLSNSSGATSSGSYSAPVSSHVESLRKELVFACNKSTSFNMQFTINSPSLIQSRTITVDHNCNDI